MRGRARTRGIARGRGAKIPGLKVIDLQASPPGRELWLGYHRDLRDVPRLKAIVRALLSAQVIV